MLHDDPGALSPYQPTRLSSLLAVTGDDFGAPLALGEIDGDANLDLAVGAPGGGGRVVVCAGRTPTESAPTRSAMATLRQALTDQVAFEIYGVMMGAHTHLRFLRASAPANSGARDRSTTPSTPPRAARNARGRRAIRAPAPPIASARRS